jgi:hypothetical protein
MMAFSPSVFLFLFIAFSKAHLMIVVTTAAFSYLIAAFLTSLLWLPFPSSLATNAALLIIPAVFMQTVCRCGYVFIFHKVEGAIVASIKLHEQQEQADSSETRPNTGETGRGNGGDQQTDAARLRFELNDWTCGLSAGVGYGFMKALMLYGTLLANEASEPDGTLYQESCSMVPSVVNSALNTFLFSLLDIILMLITFYGMRRRRYLKQQRTGNIALAVSFACNLLAGSATTFNQLKDGCLISVPLLGAVLLATGAYFVWGIGVKNYLPKSQRRANREARHMD